MFRDVERGVASRLQTAAKLNIYFSSKVGRGRKMHVIEQWLRSVAVPVSSCYTHWADNLRRFIARNTATAIYGGIKSSFYRFSRVHWSTVRNFETSKVKVKDLL